MIKVATILTIATLLLLNGFCYSQQNEVGFGLGAFNYTGDIARNLQSGNISPGATIFYRRNLNDAISIRGSLTGGIVKGDDTPSFDVLGQRRDASFSRGLLEISPVVEYHFLDHRENINILNWTPYFFAGIGATFFGQKATENPNYSNPQLVLPFGVGFKYILDRQWSLGLEAGIRKTFFDYLDNVSEGDLAVKNFNFGNRHDDDWYYFLGLSLSYTFYTIPCPYNFN